jgi:hypothetical protein
MKPKAILKKLRNEGMPSIKLSQLKYQITKYDKLHNPSREFTMRDIVNWSDTHATRPDDTDYFILLAMHAYLVHFGLHKTSIRK